MKSISIVSMFVAFTLASCVSQKKFDEMALLRDKAEIRNEQLNNRIKLQESQIFELEKQAEALRQLQAEYQRLMVTRDNLANEVEDCRNRYETLLEQNRTILNASTDEKASLQKQLAEQQLLLDAKQKELAEIESALVERERRLTELTTLMDAQNQKISALKDKVTNALLGFSARDLSIVEKNGRVYVTLSQNLLFPKGSRQIDKNGVNAISKLAAVLAQNPDIHINVEGHTDSDGSADLNWDLSVTRATAVTKILIDNGVSPTQVTPSGRAYYDPVAPNDTEENKSRNRRTEIILAPKLDDLFEIIKG
jgi:chemotaxis protein MotB